MNPLLLNGGHIGDGVRPSERRKGIATKMIELALQECKQLGISNGIVYHRKGIHGDYDDFKEVEELILFIKTGIK